MEKKSIYNGNNETSCIYVFIMSILKIEIQWQKIEDIHPKEGMLIVGYNKENDPEMDIFVWKDGHFYDLGDWWKPDITHAIILPQLPEPCETSNTKPLESCWGNKD